MSPFCTVQISLWVFSTSVYGKNRSSKIIQIRLQVELTGLRKPWRQIHPWEVSGLVGDLLSCLAKAFWRDACAEPLREEPGPRERQLNIGKNWFLGTRSVSGFCMSAKRAVSLLRGIHFTLGTMLVSSCCDNVTDSTLPVRCLRKGWQLCSHLLVGRRWRMGYFLTAYVPYT